MFVSIFQTYDGTVVNSTSYKDGSFVLQLANPVQGGSYICRVPEASLHRACVEESLNGSVRVDVVGARLSLLEAEKDALKAENVALTQQLANNTQELQQVTEQLHELQAQSTHQDQELTTLIGQLDELKPVLGQNLTGEFKH